MIVEKLRKMGDEIQTAIPWINHGGCCVYAAAVCNALSELGYTAWGVVLDCDSEGDMNQIKQKHNPLSPRDWNDHGVKFMHVVTQFEENDGTIWTHDSTKTVSDERAFESMWSEVRPGYLTIPDLVELASHNKGWNSMFDRGKIPLLLRLVTKHLRRI